jgi:pimeloyl-ACP methyl ester carboxylesterase
VLAATHAGQSRRASLPERAHVPKDRPFLALYSAGFARDHPDRIAEDIVTGSRNRQPAHARRRQWEAVQAWDAWERLGSIACPVLVLHGSEDGLVAAENARMLADRIPGAQLVLLEGAGHVYHAEQPEAADAAVMAFLRRVDGGSP